MSQLLTLPSQASVSDFISLASTEKPSISKPSSAQNHLDNNETSSLSGRVTPEILTPKPIFPRIQLHRESSSLTYDSPRKGDLLGIEMASPRTIVTSFQKFKSKPLEDALSPSMIRDPAEYHDIEKIPEMLTGDSWRKTRTLKNKNTHTFSPHKKIEKGIRAIKSAIKRCGKDAPFPKGQIYKVEEKVEDETKVSYFELHDRSEDGSFGTYPLVGDDFITLSGDRAFQVVKDFKDQKERSFEKFLKDRLSVPILEDKSTFGFLGDRSISSEPGKSVLEDELASGSKDRPLKRKAEDESTIHPPKKSRSGDITIEEEKK